MRNTAGRRAIGVGAVVCLLLLTPAAASASSAGGQSTAAALLYPIINFSLFLGVLIYAYRKSLKGALRARRTSTEQHLEKAAQELEEATGEYIGLARQLREFEKERENIVRALREEGEEMARLLMERSEQEAKRIVEESAKRRENELRLAQAELRIELVQRAVEELRLKLERGLSPDDDRRLRREVLATFGR